MGISFKLDGKKPEKKPAARLDLGADDADNAQAQSTESQSIASFDDLKKPKKKGPVIPVASNNGPHIGQAASHGDVSDADYADMPVSQFGAAMLRGMAENGKKGDRRVEPFEPKPRPARLGLGASLRDESQDNVEL